MNQFLSAGAAGSGVLLLASAALPVTAAQVPAGVTLNPAQQMVINNGTEVATLDPQKNQGVPESNVMVNLLESLVGTDNQGRLVPGVAESWQQQQFKVWTFTLRDDAKWSNGDPVTAADFVWSWQRLGDPKTASPYASLLHDAHLLNADAVIAGKLPVSELGVKALDDRHLQVTLSAPVPWFLAMAANTALSPVHRKTVEQWGDKWTLPEHYVGNGAYRLSQWVVNEKIVVTRNPHYWNNATTVIEQGTFLPIASSSSAINRYLSGEIDMTEGALPPERFAQLKKDLGSQVHVNPLLCTFLYQLNSGRPPFNDQRVRTAVKMTLDRDVIANRIMGQGQIPAYSLTPPFTRGASLSPPAWFGLSQAERNQQARALLAEAGYGAANPLRFSLLYNTSDVNQKQAIAAASMWKKNLGAEVTLQNQEWKTSLDSVRQGQYDAARATWCGDYNDPASFLTMMLSHSSSNTFFYRSPAFDQLMQQSLTAGDDAARAAIYQQAERQLDNDSALVPVYYRVSARLIKPWVGGFTGRDPADLTNLKYYYLTQH